MSTIIEALSGHWAWLTLGLVLAALEMIVPGVYLIWLAAAAIVTGVLVLLSDLIAPGALGVPLQVVIFAALSVASLYLARRWLHEKPIESADPFLNRRAAQLIGQVVLVTQAIAHGEGRVKAGDSEWMARGADAAAGDYVRVTGADGLMLLVERES